MDTKRIKGLQVITLAGINVGAVDQIFFDPATKRVAGFVLQADPALAGGLPRLIDAGGTLELAADAVTLPEAATVHDRATTDQFPTRVKVEVLAKLQLVTDEGTLLGDVATIELDPRTLQLARIEVSPGCVRGDQHVLAELHVRIGPDVAVVA